jgi:ATP-binding cassette subfamily B protein
MKELKKLKKYLKKYKFKLIAGFIFIILSNFFTTLIPTIIKDSVDLLNNINQPNIINLLIKQTILIILFSALGGIFRYYIRQTIIVSSRLIENDLRNDLFEHIIKLPYRFFYKNSTGNLMALATNDINAVRNFLGPSIMYSVDNIIKLIFILIMLLRLDVKLTILSLLPLPFISIIVIITGRKVNQYYSQVLKKFAFLTSIAQENISLVRVVKAYNLQNNFVEKFDNENNEYYHLNMKMFKIMSLVQPLLVFLVGTSLTINLLLGGYDVLTGRLSVGSITAFTIYLGLLIWPMFAFGWVTNMVQQAIASMKRLNEIFSLSEEPITTNITLNEVIKEIKFHNVSLSLDNINIINNISFTIKKGQKVAFIGKTGAGKSTIFNLITKIYEPTSGNIYINNIDIKNISHQELRSNITYITQEPFLFSDSIKNNILYCCKNADTKILQQAINIAGLIKDIENFPEGVETIIGERGITLSGGQKQRTAIARAIASNSEIYLFDDSFSAIDTNTEEIILKNLFNFLENKTAIFISHRISTIKNCDYIYIIDNGKIIEQGTHNHLLEKGGYYTKLYNHQLLEKELDEL